MMCDRATPHHVVSDSHQLQLLLFAPEGSRITACFVISEIRIQTCLKLGTQVSVVFQSSFTTEKRHKFHLCFD